MEEGIVNKYFVNAENEAGTAGERPLIEAESAEEAQAIYEGFGTGYAVTSVDVA